jgi:hypothetical protein
MAHCGMRREEVSQISVDRIGWERSRVSFIGKMHGKHQPVPVPPDLMHDIKF